MDEPVPERPFAWQPLTPCGLAKFARASFGRVFLMQFIVALFAAASVVWFLSANCYPIIRAAIGRLPENGEIRSGRMNVEGEWPAVLAENRFLALAIDPGHVGEVRSPAHLAVEFGREDIRIFSLLGFTRQPYPADWVVPMNRTELIPWWGAWAPPISVIAAFALIAGLMVAWACLASIYAPVAWLIGYFANRDLNLTGSWRLAGAALMPGALLLVTTIIAYGLGWLDLVHLGVAMAAHFVVGWIYLVTGVLAVQRLSAYAERKSNPFAARVDPATTPEPKPQEPADH
jgi:hypothetical protein